MRPIVLAGATALAISLSSCATTPPDAPSEPTPVESTQSGQDLNEHGAVAVAIGETITVSAPGDTEPAVTLSLTGVQPDVQCTEDFSFPAPRGQWLGLTFDVTTAADYEEVSGGAPMRLFGNDFFAVGVDGKPVGLSAGSGCILGEFPLDVPAATTTSGVLILDAPADTASVIWKPSTFVVEVPSYEWPTN